MKGRLLATFGLTILLAHAVITAFVPAGILLLTGHNHIALGIVTDSDWRAHEQAHLRMATVTVDEYDHHTHPATPHKHAPEDKLLTVPGHGLDTLISNAGDALALPEPLSLMPGSKNHTALPAAPRAGMPLSCPDVPCPPPKG